MEHTEGVSPTPPAQPGPAGPGVLLSDTRAAPRAARAIPPRRTVLATIVGATLLVAALVGVLAYWVSSRLAEREILDEGARLTDLLVSSELQPRITPALQALDPAAQRALDAAVAPTLRHDGALRLKVFDAGGRVLYSDEPRLIGQTFPFDAEERQALDGSSARAVLSSPHGLEDEYERVPGRLVEVRQPVVADGHRFLVEVYFDYHRIGARAVEMWRVFIALLGGSLALMLLLVIPITWRLSRGLDDARAEREALLERAVESSQLERRRIAGTLHDGPVQELAAATLALSASAQRLDRDGHPGQAATVRESAASVRGAMRSLRTLLVDLYPATLGDQGLAASLADLVEPLRSHGADVELAVHPRVDSAVPLPDQRLVFRVASECLLNVVKHAEASRVVVRLDASGRGWTLTIADDGRGFSLEDTFRTPEPGHLGLHVLADLASDAGAALRVATRPGEGTVVTLTRENA